MAKRLKPVDHISVDWSLGRQCGGICATGASVAGRVPSRGGGAEWVGKARIGFRSSLLFVAVFLRVLIGCFAGFTASWVSANESAHSQTAFGDRPVYPFEITVSPEGIKTLDADPREYVGAEVRCGVTNFSGVGVHLKGSVGSFRKLDDKPGLTLDLNRFASGQSFFGATKIHLNNSVEDPSYLSQKLGSELFLAAGIPAPRVAHALVTLNGRPLGLYVLTEGFTPEFLVRHFGRADGKLYEPDTGHDVDQPLKLQLGKHFGKAKGKGKSHWDIDMLAAAAKEPDMARRWLRLGQALDTDRFARFMALEIMIGHRDGYGLARNNFRIYCDPDSGRAVFLPHGMDQLFGKADLTWRPAFAGTVARSFYEVSEGKAAYEREMRALESKVFDPEWGHLLDSWAAGLRSSVPSSESEAIQTEARALSQRIVERGAWLKRAIDSPEPMPLSFENGAAQLKGWEKGELHSEGANEPSPAKLDMAKPSGVAQACLHIQAERPAAASWRTQVRLQPGRYRFGGQARVSGFKPLPFGKHQGARLRVGGRSETSDPMVAADGGVEWTPLAVEFEVGVGQEEVELICELRAASGEAWFDLPSLRLEKLNR